MVCSPQTKQQTKGDLYCQYMSSAQSFWLPVVVWYQQGWTNARDTRSKPLPTETQWHGGGCFYRITPVSHSKTGRNYQSSPEKIVIFWHNTRQLCRLLFCRGTQSIALCYEAEIPRTLIFHGKLICRLLQLSSVLCQMPGLSAVVVADGRILPTT